ncbi:hypothetical protein LDU51_001959 [Salmonella enterica]|nr:hypothetical protein [Salmonella enterica]ECP3268748.1 hypothetical protein [Salmonella enterica subsp. enterica serovar [1],13,23:g,z51:-]EDO6343574.1 hypothetical protein [Salmonella enterica subsp. houtenae serovar 48:g,z51:-]EAO9786611.1 hypothetical protein [Salmonella enterica]EAQ6403872.1 hypothetical protein [Salmonella enterica]
MQHIEWLVLPITFFCIGLAVDRAINKLKDNTQSKVEAIYRHMNDLEERMMRHSDWNRAICQKESYDKIRSEWEAEKIATVESAESLEGEDGVEAMLRMWDVIKKRSYEIYPEKKIEDFLE